jgi:hypothetical protein
MVSSPQFCYYDSRNYQNLASQDIDWMDNSLMGKSHIFQSCESVLGTIVALLCMDCCTILVSDLQAQAEILQPQVTILKIVPQPPFQNKWGLQCCNLRSSGFWDL